MLQTFEAMSVYALLLQRPDNSLDYPILLRAMRGNELLVQPIASHQACIITAGEHESVIRAKRKRASNLPQRAKAGDQGLFERGACSAGLAAPRKLPAK